MLSLDELLSRDIEAMKKGNLCDEKEMEKCLEEYDESELAWACENCPKLQDADISPYTRKLLNVRTLQRAGFPLDADFLTYEEWLDLGRVNAWLEPPRMM